MNLKRFTLFIITLIISITVVYAQTPNSFNYQAVVRNSDGEPITNQSVALKFNIKKGSTSGTVIFSETHSISTNDFGLVNVKIGEGSAVNGNISNIEWGSDEYYLEVLLDKDGGNNYQSIGTSQFVSVPYALFSKRSENTFSGNYSDLTNTPSFATVATSGYYDDLLNKPSDVTDLSNHSIVDLSDFPTFTANKWLKVNSTGDGIELADSPGGTDLSNYTTDDLSEGSNNLYFTDSRAISAINNDGDHGSTASHNYFSGNYNDLSNTPNLATVATSGDYTDLSSKPNLDDILDNGNSAGNNTLDMNNEDIINIKDLHLYDGDSDIWLDNASELQIENGSGDREGIIKGGDGNYDQVEFIINNILGFLDWDENTIMTVNGFGSPNEVKVYGDFEVTGSKNFVEEHPQDSTKEIVYSALEGPEVATYIRDRATLNNGETTIEFPEHYSLVTEESGLTAQVTPVGNCNGLYVKELTKNKLVVKELNNGTSNVDFYYLVHGIRKGYEDFEVIREKEGKEVHK